MIARKLTMAILSSCVFAGIPLAVFAASLGDLKLYSNLNEPLDADVPLMDAAKIQPGDIKITIASEDEYKKAGYEYEKWFATINPVLEINPDTQARWISLKTTEPVKEPFVDILLEVAWPGGQYTREYTVLLDPANNVVGNSALQKAVRGEMGLKRASRSQASAQIPDDVVPSRQIAMGRYYGPIGEETLWSIAKKLVEGSSYSVQQAIDAIAQKNPQAFRHNNVHQMIRGAVLALPTAEEMSQLYPQTSSRVSSKATDPAASVPLATPELPADTTQSASRTGEKRLTLSAPLETDTDPLTPQQASAIKTPEVSKKLMQVEETISTLKHSNDTIQTTNQRLESQNESLSAILSMKEEEIRQLKSALQHDSSFYAVVKPDQKTGAASTNVDADLDEDVDQEDEAGALPPPKVASESSSWGTWFLWLLALSGLGGVYYAARLKKKDPEKFEEYKDLLQEYVEKIKRKQWKSKAETEEDFEHGATFDLANVVHKVSQEEVKQQDIRGEELIDPKSVEYKGFVNRVEATDIDIAFERYGVAEKTLQIIIDESPLVFEAWLKLLEVYVLTENYKAFNKTYADLPENLEKIRPDIWSKIEQLSTKVSRENVTNENIEQTSAESHTRQKVTEFELNPEAQAEPDRDLVYNPMTHEPIKDLDLGASQSLKEEKKDEETNDSPVRDATGLEMPEVTEFSTPTPSVTPADTEKQDTVEEDMSPASQKPESELESLFSVPDDLPPIVEQPLAPTEEKVDPNKASALAALTEVTEPEAMDKALTPEAVLKPISEDKAETATTSSKTEECLGVPDLPEVAEVPQGEKMTTVKKTASKTKPLSEPKSEEIHATLAPELSEVTQAEVDEPTPRDKTTFIEATLPDDLPEVTEKELEEPTPHDIPSGNKPRAPKAQKPKVTPQTPTPSVEKSSEASASETLENLDYKPVAKSIKETKGTTELSDTEFLDLEKHYDLSLDTLPTEPDNTNDSVDKPPQTIHEKLRYAIQLVQEGRYVAVTPILNDIIKRGDQEEQKTAQHLLSQIQS